MARTFSFATEVRVRFAETDAQGVAHNSNYFVWFEVARIDYLERHAGGYQRLRDEGIESFVLESHARFLVPAVFDDRLVVQRPLPRRARRAVPLRVRGHARRRRRSPTAGRSTARVDAVTLRPTRLPAWLVEASLLRRRRRRRRDVVSVGGRSASSRRSAPSPARGLGRRRLGLSAFVLPSGFFVFFGPIRTIFGSDT